MALDATAVSTIRRSRGARHGSPLIVQIKRNNRPPPVNQIAEIDRTLTTLFEGFVNLTEQLRFTPICDLSDEATVAKQQYAGIYKIDIEVTEPHKTLTEWISWFTAEWVQERYERKFVPNPKKKRLAAHSELAQWMPLYLGKSKNIAGRVWEHINLKLAQPTTAMKLKERSNMANQRFRLSTIRVEVENYDLIMPKLESALRDKYNPVLGRQ